MPTYRDHNRTTDGVTAKKILRASLYRRKNDKGKKEAIACMS